MFSIIYIQTWRAVITMNCEAAIKDTSGKEDVPRSIDIITAVYIKNYSISSVASDKNLGLFLNMMKIYKFLSVFAYVSSI